ncbi:hypothetical protein ACC717_37730, partial [Rhizobium ruizarguesonis]
GCVGALSAFYHDSTDITDPHQLMVASLRMIAKMPTLAAMAYKHRIDHIFLARHGKAHAKEVRGVVEVVLRINEGLADMVLVG